MHFTKKIQTLILVLTIVIIFVSKPTTASASEGSVAVPVIIDQGFQMWAKKGTASFSFDVWRKGGLLESDAKPGTLTSFFSRIDGTVGNYKSYEIVDAKVISASSKVIYVAVNFERAAVYGRFLVYRTDKNWVIQNMDFSFKPEALMPWLAFVGDNSTSN